MKTEFDLPQLAGSLSSNSQHPLFSQASHPGQMLLVCRVMKGEHRTIRQVAQRQLSPPPPHSLPLPLVPAPSDLSLSDKQ